MAGSRRRRSSGTTSSMAGEAPLGQERLGRVPSVCCRCGLRAWDPAGVEGFRLGGSFFETDRGEDPERLTLDEALGTEALLLGRLSYEFFAATWPGPGWRVASAARQMCGRRGPALDHRASAVVASLRVNASPCCVGAEPEMWGHPRRG